MKLPKRWIEPCIQITDVEERRKVRLLAIIIMANILALVAVLILFLGFPEIADPTRKGLPTTSLFFGMVLNLIFYLIARTRFYKYACGAMIGSILINISYVIVESPTFQNVAAGSVWVCICVLTSSLILSVPATGVTTLICLLDLVFLAFKVPESSLGMLISNIIYFLCSSVLVIIGSSMRNRTQKLLNAERAVSMHASKLTSLGEMAGGIAHEINTPLAAIVLNAEMMLKKLDLKPDQYPEDFYRHTNSILNTSRRISKIIGALRAHSRDATNDPFHPLDIKKVVQSTLDLCQEQYRKQNIDITFENLDPYFMVHGQEIQLSQVLLNLLSNSADAIQNLPQKWIRIRREVVGTNIVISITDSGHGIPKAVLDKIFNPFFTTKEVGKGTGLGLSISKKIVENHGGILEYDAKSINTRFVIKIPWVASPQKVVS